MEENRTFYVGSGRGRQAPFTWTDTSLLGLVCGRTPCRTHYCHSIVRGFSPEAAAAAEYYRSVGIRSQLVIPLSVGGRIVAAVGFGSFRKTRNWPEDFIARVNVIGGVIAQALVRKRSAAVALRASEERWRSIFGDINSSYHDI